MATNLLIGYADIPASATTVTYTNTAATGYPVKNLFGGSRTDLFKCSTAEANHRFTFDLGASTTKAANFLFLARAYLLQRDNIGTVTLKGHSADNYGAATTVSETASYASVSMVGPHSEDWLTTFSVSSAYRYWFVNYATASTSYAPHSQLFFGTAFDPGKDPVEGFRLERKRFRGSQRKAIYAVKLRWEGVSYSKTVQMHDLIARKRRVDSFVLYTTAYHELLNNHRLLHCRCTEFTAPPRVTDYCDIEATFEEII